jgi:F-type H+-transporting ATPase subunit gamma
MANLKEVRERITSVISTQQITKAMKMVAASKLRRAQQSITQLRPYANKLQAMLSNILASSEEDDNQVSFGVERPVKNALVVLVTSSRGLCGAFNSNLLKTAVQLIHTKYDEAHKAGTLTMLCIGKKGYDFFKKRFPNIKLISDYVELVGKDFSFNSSEPVSSLLMEQFEKETYDAIDIVYSQFKNAATQFFTVEQFLPVPKATNTDNDTVNDFIFEPNQAEILEVLVPTILKTQFYKTIIDTTASEHGARMTSMDKATDNAEELLKMLKINYNKARQENITRELSEIVGGVAALESA